MEEGTFLGPASVPGRLYRVGWYPGLVLDAEEAPVAGEVFEIGGALLRELDAFEGAAGEAGDEYERVKAEVTWNQTGRGEEVWVWEFRRAVDGLPRIASGDWLADRSA
jgi:gamma-glutamylcyclotransferase (GGCT)/AIG2-like uncharacterized protein YtfP